MTDPILCPINDEDRLEVRSHSPIGSFYDKTLGRKSASELLKKEQRNLLRNLLSKLPNRPIAAVHGSLLQRRLSKVFCAVPVACGT
jgi:hypothetical protein